MLNRFLNLTSKRCCKHTADLFENKILLNHFLATQNNQKRNKTKYFN